MAEKEICYIQGTVSKVEEGSSGWMHFFIDKGTDYPVKLSTKKEDLITEARRIRDAKVVASWKYQLSLGGENPHKPGTRYKNRRLEAIKEGRHGNVTEREPELDGETSSSSSSTSAPTGGQNSTRSEGGGGDRTYTQNDLHPEGVRRVEEAGRRKVWSIAIGQATEQLKHTFRSDEDLDAQWERIRGRAEVIVRLTSGEWAWDRDPEYLPEALRPDPSLPKSSGVAAPDGDEWGAGEGDGGERAPQDDYDPGPVDDDIPF